MCSNYPSIMNIRPKVKNMEKEMAKIKMTIFYVYVGALKHV